MEITQGRPYTFIPGGGYSGRVWVNGAGMVRDYFGYFNDHLYHLFSDWNTDQITLCSTTDPGTDNMEATGSNYDMMNFVWFKGSENLFAPTDGKFAILATLLICCF